MEQEKSSPKAWDLLDEIRGGLQNFEPASPAHQVLYEQGFERMRDLGAPDATGCSKPSKVCLPSSGSC
jgi:hypothetical protein